ncbi:hypothetical protein [Cellulomonas sp. URHB0016]
MAERVWAGGGRRARPGGRDVAPRASRGPAGRRLVAGLLGSALLGSAGLAGCSQSPAPSTPVAQVAVQADCLAPQVLTALELVPAASSGRARRAAHPDVPAPGRVPDDFVPESVVTCTTGGRLRDASGTWAAVTQARLEGDLQPLLALLEATRTGDAATCAEADGTRTVVWLVDSLGRAVRPVLPRDACGAPTQAVQDLLAGLDDTDTNDYPVVLLPPRGAPEG